MGPASALHLHERHEPVLAPSPRTILIVDDEESVRSLLARWLESSGYRVVMATDAEAALAIFEEDRPALMLCDIRMPGRDGLWLAARVRQDYPETAIVMSSGVQDAHAADESQRHGVVEYLTKPFGRDRLREAVSRGLEWHEAAGEASRWRRQLQAELHERRGALLRRVRGVKIDCDQDVEALLALTSTERDAYAHAHRVRFLVTATARDMGMAAADIAILGRAALVHDLGKLALPLALVRKPAALAAEELGLMRTYPAVGAAVLAEVPFLKTAAPIVRDAHERMDGDGFPHGLPGASVSLSARILGVADAFDAMTHRRVFRDAIPQAQALLELERCSGTQFDPDVIRVFASIAPC
jgi:response regulator RpfG family c-di-GMP phosphodiesterase